MTSARWDILAVENGWHGANCARRWADPEPCNCGLLELVVRLEREGAEHAASEAAPVIGLSEAWAKSQSTRRSSRDPRLTQTRTLGETPE